MTAGASVTTNYSVTVNATLAAGATNIGNTATATTGTCNACGPITNSAPNIDTVKTLATVNGTAATATTTVRAGDVLVYHFVSTNTGTADGSVALSDPVPANTSKSGGEAWSCANDSAAGTACTQTVAVTAGASVTTNYTVTVRSLSAGAQVANVATSNGGRCSGCSPTPNPTATAGSIDTVKTLATINGVAASASSTVKPRDVLVYHLVSTNTGGSDSSTALSDPVPANTTKTGSETNWSCGNRRHAAARHALGGQHGQQHRRQLQRLRPDYQSA